MDDERETRILARLERASLGVPLSQLVERPPTPHVLLGFAEACRQVGRAHEHGVVHRDLRPYHIVVGEHEVQVRGWEHARLDDEDETTLTRVATTRYFAPERSAGVVDARGDVYALGCILFELLAGEPMHGELGALDAARRSPSLRRPDRRVPVELDALCVAATAPELAHRVQTARELGDRVALAVAGDPAASQDPSTLARAVLPAYLLYCAFVPTFLWFAAGERVFAVVMTALVGATVGVLFHQSRRPRSWPLLFALLNVSLVVLTCRIASVYSATTIAAVTVAGMAFGPSYARGRWLAVLAAAMCLAVLVPLFAERAGWLSPTISLAPDGYTIVAPVFHLRPVGRWIGFSGYVISTIVASALLVHALVRHERRTVRH